MSIYLFNACKFWIFGPLYFVKITVKITESSKSWPDIHDVMMLRLALVTVGRSHPTHYTSFLGSDRGCRGRGGEKILGRSGVEGEVIRCN